MEIEVIILDKTTLLFETTSFNYKLNMKIDLFTLDIHLHIFYKRFCLSVWIWHLRSVAWNENQPLCYNHEWFCLISKNVYPMILLLERTMRIVGKRPYHKLNCPCSVDNHSIIRKPTPLLFLFSKHIIDWSCYMISHKESQCFVKISLLRLLFYNNKYCSRA